MKERPDIGVYVKDLSTFVVKGPEHMDKLMMKGAKNSELCNAFCNIHTIVCFQKIKQADGQI